MGYASYVFHLVAKEIHKYKAISRVMRLLTSNWTIFFLFHCAFIPCRYYYFPKLRRLPYLMFIYAGICLLILAPTTSFTNPVAVVFEMKNEVGNDYRLKFQQEDKLFHINSDETKLSSQHELFNETQNSGRAQPKRLHQN